MIKEQIQQAINNLQQEKMSALRNAEASIINEKITPYNSEADALKDKAIEQLTANFNAEMNALKAKFASDRDAIIVANNQKKEANRVAIIEVETKAIRDKYDNTIAQLQAMSEKLGE